MNYIYNYSDLRDKNVFKLYNQKGELVKTYRFREDIDLVGGIYIYDGYIRRLYKGEKVFKIERDKKVPIKKRKDFLIPSLDTEDSIYPEPSSAIIPSEVTKEGERKGIKKKILLQLPDKYFGYYEPNIYYITDKAVFVRCKTGFWPPKYMIAKYDKKTGKLLSIIKLKGEEEQYTLATGLEIPDSQGNAYQVWTTKEGVYVIKWSKIEK
jgi:hypothetical protein